MKRYEVIHEIFNKCAGDGSAQIDISTIETDDIDAWLTEKLHGEAASIERLETTKGAVIFNVEIAGMRERYSFTEL
jgi:hypothetical protein